MRYSEAMVAALTLCLLIQKQRIPDKIYDSNFKLAIKVMLDGERIAFADTQPMMVASRILVPMRGVFEKLGAELHWDPSLKQVSAERGTHHILLPLGKNTAEVDGQPVALDQPAISVQGRTMVPLRFLGESLGVKVDWLPADRTVALESR